MPSKKDKESPPKKAIDQIKNEKHKQFVYKYIAYGFNGTRAYMDVYPKAKEATAAVKASELVRKDNIKAALEEAYEDILDRDKAEAKAMLVGEMRRIAHADISEFVEYKEDGVHFRPQDEPKDTKPVQMISSVKTVTTTKQGDTIERTQMSFKMHDKLKAMDMLGKFHKIIGNVEHTGKDGGPIEVQFISSDKVEQW